MLEQDRSKRQKKKKQQDIYGKEEKSLNGKNQVGTGKQI